MAQKKDKQNTKTNPVVSKQLSPKKQRPVPEQNPVDRLPHSLLLIAISLITWLFFQNSLSGQLTDWDDKGYILSNKLLADLSFTGLKNIFTTPVMGHYHPITVLIYAIEYHFTQFDPWLYHFDSVLFHMVAVILVYWFTYQLTKNKTTAVVTSLLFSLHPMHVESVAWVAGRKDILCTIFYFGACIAYLNFTRATAGNKKKVGYFGVIVLYICALLCKPVAVTLPLVLLLIDYYEKRSWKISLLAEKIPFLLLAVFFGLLSIKISHEGGVMDVHKEGYAFWERIAIMGYGFSIYFWKTLLPINLHNFYPYPEKVNGSISYYYCLYPISLIAIAFAGWYYLRNQRNIVFGALFFIVNIALFIKFIPVGEAIVAERYTYTPYFGLFFIAGGLISSLLVSSTNRFLKYIILSIFFIILGYATSERCKAWHDTPSLWTDEMKKEGEEGPLSYNNLGFYYFEKRTTEHNAVDSKRDFDSAFFLLNKAVALKPDYINAIEGLGILYFMKNDFDSSAYYFRKFIQLKPGSEAYYDYGMVFDNTNRKDSALIEYNISIGLDSTNWKPIFNRGMIYQHQGRCDKAIDDFNRALKINPKLGSIYYQRSLCEARDGNRLLALQDVEKAISLNFNNVDKRFYNSLKNP